MFSPLAVSNNKTTSTKGTCHTLEAAAASAKDALLLKQPAKLKKEVQSFHMSSICELMATQKLVTSPPQHAL